MTSLPEQLAMSLLLQSHRMTAEGRKDSYQTKLTADALEVLLDGEEEPEELLSLLLCQAAALLGAIAQVRGMDVSRVASIVGLQASEAAEAGGGSECPGCTDGERPKLRLVAEDGERLPVEVPFR